MIKLELGKRYRIELLTKTVLIGVVKSFEGDSYIVTLSEHHNGEVVERDIFIAVKAIMLAEPFTWGDRDWINRGNERKQRCSK